MCAATIHYTSFAAPLGKEGVYLGVYLPMYIHE